MSGLLSPKAETLSGKSAPHMPGTFDRLDLNDACADLDRPRFQTLNLGLVSPRRPFAREKTAPTTGERQQHACTDEIKSDATLHARKNASSFFNGASTLAAGDFVKDKKSLPNQSPWP